jgi:hypothetical protein
MRMPLRRCRQQDDGKDKEDLQISINAARILAGNNPRLPFGLESEHLSFSADRALDNNNNYYCVARDIVVVEQLSE